MFGDQTDGQECSQIFTIREFFLQEAETAYGNARFTTTQNSASFTRGKATETLERLAEIIPYNMV